MTENAESTTDNDRLLRMAAGIVSAYVRNNPVPAAQLQDVIRSVYGSLMDAQAGAPASVEAQKPAVPIKRSVTPDFIICLEDGRKLKMLKRHLRTTYGMTPDEYRAKWGLDADYPMVAPNYAKRRSEFAKQIGLGQRRSAPARKRGRPRAAR